VVWPHPLLASVFPYFFVFVSAPFASFFAFCFCQILCTILFHELCALSEWFLFSSATGRLISSTDHGSVVINVGQGDNTLSDHNRFSYICISYISVFPSTQFNFALFFTFESAIVRFCISALIEFILEFERIIMDIAFQQFVADLFVLIA
jgi:hypothetical protein